ncbi:MAG: PEPxxWA-CTERM sorting domain-containing protein [Pseudomonadota bacterium]
MRFKSLFAGAAAAALVSVVVASPAAAVVITNGQYSVGVSELGQLYDAATNTGFQNTNGYDFMGGAVRDSWGVNGAYADDGLYGVNDVASFSFDAAPDASSALSVTRTTNFEVSQAFSFVAGNVLAIETTLTNISGGELSGIFQRVADFDVDPALNPPLMEWPNQFGTFFTNTIAGFDSPNTDDPWYFECCVADYDPDDYGAGLRVNFTNLAHLGSYKFTYYYAFGAEGGSQVENDLLNAGAQGGISVEHADGLAGGMGLSIPGGAVVPEPSTWALMIGGFGLAGATLRRRRAVHA